MIGNSKASGPDEIPGELIKYGGNIVAELLYPLINKIWQQNYVPDNMKEAFIVLIPKKRTANSHKI